MRNLKKALCLALACVMLLGMMVMTTSAVDFTDQDEIVNTEAVNTLVALNIVNGKEDGSYFDPTGIVTRAEMAKLICVALNGGKDPQLGTVSTSFTDTNGSWAAGYIEYCYNLGIIAGRGDGTFDPTGTVTGTEAAKMLLVALGYNAKTEGFIGDTWAIAVNVRANQKDLYDELETLNPSNGLSRDDAAQMVYNAVNAVMVEYSYSLTTVNGTLTSVAVVKDNSNKDTILSEKFNTVTKYGRIVGITFNSDTGKYTYSFDDGTATTDLIGETTLTTTKDYSGLYGQNVKVLYKNNSDRTVYGFYAEDSKVLAEGILNDIGTVKATSFKFKGTVYSVDAASTDLVPVYYMTSAAGLGDAAAYVEDPAEGALAVGYSAAQKPFDCKLIDNDNDGKVDYIIAVPFTVAKVTYVGSSTFTAGSSFKFDDVETYDGMAKNDYVVITAAANTAKNITTFTKVDSVASGKATSTNAAGTQLTVDGTAYNIYTTQCTGSAFGTASVGETYEKMQVVNGFVFYASKSASVSSGDFAVVTAIESSPSGVSSDPQAKLLLTDGTKIVVSYDKDASTAASGGTAVAKGDFVSYDKDSDSIYTLTKYQSLNVSADTDYDGALTSADYAYDKDGKSTIDGCFIDDNAVIFYLNNSGTWSVKSGAELKKTASSSVGTVDVAYYNENSATGFNSVVLAYISSTTTISDSNIFYGYLTADAGLIKNSDNETVSQVTLWNGSEKVTLTCDDNYSTSANITAIGNALAKNSIIVYTVDGDEITISKCYPVKSTSNSASVGGTAAIVGYDETSGILNFKSGATTVTSPVTNFEITSDTVVLYIDVENAAGVASGEISMADETSTEGTYYNNAFFLFDSANKNELSLLVIDVANDIADSMN